MEDRELTNSERNEIYLSELINGIYKILTVGFFITSAWGLYLGYKYITLEECYLEVSSEMYEYQRD